MIFAAFEQEVVYGFLGCMVAVGACWGVGLLDAMQVSVKADVAST